MTQPLRAVFLEAGVLSCKRDGLYHQLLLENPGLPESGPGSFSMLRVPGDPSASLLRPMSLLDCGGSLRFLFKPVGRMTRQMTLLKEGDSVQVFGPLGNSFRETSASSVLIAGGVGLPPIHFLSRRLSGSGLAHRMILGFNHAEEIPRDLLSELTVKPEICTLDGSEGFSGNPVECLLASRGDEALLLQACGPLPMLKALAESAGEEDQVELSLEERMACGVGACRSCVVPVEIDGLRSQLTVCREGPVFEGRTLFRKEKHAGSSN
ncbi:MAG: dihydroorotate dehydrogenase electron transfer subunit [Candidatus Krumholzibacteria bacterium]|jgi:dihydroorotate dehydrogenase electron transfer subunit|nr:dihydroorotate dehydrogenase electron transfer subunit [Candidatus Krumholzibacteria bacterium]MDP6669379.1 dihydroorotate dehydrogenase electron transfer subunit [Candidatus Krumholzibacteria bacterium]MDP6797207.1 dihydroorotate dehydrogenase electron transfer subunit [Candidatus Krumholzibacteria bacterium]MDP7022500.1 dihydroorotate dehydrogenase electron transfer subunit [Candidatus Krumholzibacteria bacterium]